MFDNLSERLERSFKILKGEGRITEINIAETVKDIRKALLEADVNYKTAKQFTDQVKEKALGQNVITAVRPGQLMVKITHDELAALMGGEAQEINLKGTPAVILMAGLQGSGKTTFASKLANYLLVAKLQGRNFFHTSSSGRGRAQESTSPAVIHWPSRVHDASANRHS